MEAARDFPGFIPFQVEGWQRDIEIWQPCYQNVQRRYSWLGIRRPADQANDYLSEILRARAESSMGSDSPHGSPNVLMLAQSNLGAFLIYHAYPELRHVWIVFILNTPVFSFSCLVWSVAKVSPFLGGAAHTSEEKGYKFDAGYPSFHSCLSVKRSLNPLKQALFIYRKTLFIFTCRNPCFRISVCMQPNKILGMHTYIRVCIHIQSSISLFDFFICMNCHYDLVDPQTVASLTC